MASGLEFSLMPSKNKSLADKEEAFIYYFPELQKQPRLFQSSMSWHSRDLPIRGTSCSNKKRTIPGTNPSPSAILRTPSSCRDCTIDLAACQHLGHQKPTGDRQRGFRILIKMEKAFRDLQVN
ncbi:hypothetical protein CEXT_447961 [Caerostris extrusa]|uniref:Uncharacterized protein n=1 Tax=Caerostris extrusa TaxID=172846 RepID=A0AAV4R0N2_CAEEX|nr:hypothetical protein CEXT_447961 [Caerostris extrusa]